MIITTTKDSVKFMDFGDDIKEAFDTSNDPPPENMVDMATIYGMEKRSIKSAEAKIKQRKQDLAIKEATLYALLEDAGISSFSSGGYTFFQRVDMYASVDASKTEIAFKWLEGEDLEYLIKRTVNSRSLSSAVKTVIEETGDTPGEEEGINIKTVNRVGVRKK